jgi:hypothetical protein
MSDTTQANTPQQPIDVEKRVGQFVLLRDLKAELKAKHDEELKPVNDTLQMIKDELMQAMQQNNATSIKANSGTVSLTTKQSASAADPNAFWAWCITQGTFDMIDKKPNVTAVAEYVAQHGVAPPGVNFSVFQDVGVRRK